MIPDTHGQSGDLNDPIFECLTADGEMGRLVLEKNWSATGLGAIVDWPQSLKTAVGLVLGSPVPIVMLWGPDGIMIYNDAYSVFAGARHPDLLGVPVLTGWPEVAEFNRRVMTVGLAGGALSFRDEHLVLNRNGKPEDVWLNLDYSPIRDESGAPAGVLAIVVETTQRVQAEHRVRELNATLEAQVHKLAELDRAKTSFFTNISHEFRTPLTLMLGPTEDALASPGCTMGVQDLEILYRNELRLLKLVNALLDFSRIEAGRSRASFQPVDLARATRDIASTFQSAIERAGLVYVVDCEPLSEPLHVDLQMWEQIVLNLLSNALKFTFEGAVRVSLRDVGDAVALVVQDTGTGIAAGDIPHVFERFRRVEGAKARTQEGSGIGLALVAEMLRLHGGAVTVDSVVGQGSTFTVRLRKGASHLPQEMIGAPPTLELPNGHGAFVAEALRWLPGAADAPEVVSAAPVPPAAPLKTVPGRVLVADDNADMREYLSRLLGVHWSVEAVSDGIEALAAARRRPPDVIVTDVMMPGLDGFSLLKQLREDARTAGISVIVVSARAGDESRVEGLQFGADDYLVKPFSARELVARVNTQMALAQNLRERTILLHREQVARRDAELQREHLTAVFTQAPVIIAVLRGPDHVVEFANPLACQAWGRTCEQIVDRPLLEALPELGTQVFRDRLQEVYRSGLPCVGIETAALLDRRGDGSVEEVHFSSAYAPFRNVHGTVEGVFVVASDVTEQVRARMEVDQLREAAESANRTKDEFLAMLGHELRNPLAPIVTALQVMRLRGDRTLEWERAVIERQVTHITRLVDDLLDVSRITRGNIALKKQTVELAEVVARGLETASPLIERKAQRLELAVPREGLLIEADPLRLAQVVSNLLANASKYTDPEGHISVAARREGADVVMRVSDAGVGIAPELLPHVFDAFVQGGQASDRSNGGLGLGLAIVRSLVGMHGGTVSAHSDGVGRGSSFVVRLPATDASCQTTREAVEAHNLGPTGGLRILIVDDNGDAAQMLSAALTTMGYRTRVASDGPAALLVADEFRPDVALLDIGLPVMDGYELAERLRARCVTPLRLIAITGYGQDSDRQRSRAAGFETHLVKPIDLAAVQRLLSSSSNGAGQ